MEFRVSAWRKMSDDSSAAYVESRKLFSDQEYIDAGNSRYPSPMWNKRSRKASNFQPSKKNRTDGTLSEAASIPVVDFFAVALAKRRSLGQRGIGFSCRYVTRRLH